MKASNPAPIRSAARALTLFALLVVGIVALFAEPNDGSATWTRDFRASKAIAAAALYLLAKLYGRWRWSDPWLRALENQNDEEEWS